MEIIIKNKTTDKQKYCANKNTVYNYLITQTQDLKNKTALSFYNKHISYQMLFEKIEEVERALKAYGVEAGDHVLVSLPAIPEAVYLLYAINKLKAVYCALDCRSKKEEIFETMRQFSPKICFICDFHIREFKGISNVPIVCVAPAYSVSGRMSELSIFFRRCFAVRQKNIVYYHTFIKGKAQRCKIETSGRTLDSDIFGYFYTSGTTYGRKSVILSNENINAAVLQFASREKSIAVGDSLLNIMPLFTCYGVTVGTHLPLSVGVSVKLIPLVKPKSLKRTILREKPNYMITVPAHWEYFAKGRFKKVDLSFLKSVTVGGDRLDPIYENAINNIFRFCGSQAYLKLGYGLSETTSCATSPLSKEENPKGSVGKPYPFMRVEIFDTDNDEVLSVGKIGEICISGPTVCKGYYRDKIATDELLKKHGDGTVWLHSGDLGYFDKDGNLFFCERIKRMYVRFDGTKISPYSIEKALMKCPLIRQVLVLAERDSAHTHGMCARALIVFNESVEKDKVRATRLVEKYMRENLGEHMRPKYVEVVERLPHTRNGKLDYFSGRQ